MKFLITIVLCSLTLPMFAASDRSSATTSVAIGASSPVPRQRTFGSAASAQNQQPSTTAMTMRYGSSSIGRLLPTV